MSSAIKVEAYSGFKGGERPRAFFSGGRWLQVQELVDQWYGPDYVYFKVVSEDGGAYILSYAEAKGVWELVFYEDAAFRGYLSSRLDEPS